MTSDEFDSDSRAAPASCAIWLRPGLSLRNSGSVMIAERVVPDARVAAAEVGAEVGLGQQLGEQPALSRSSVNSPALSGWSMT